MFLSPMDITHLCSGFKYRQNGEKLCANHECGILKHKKTLTESLLSIHAYLTLPGLSLLHPFPIFSYIGFSPDDIKNLENTSLTYNEVANIRYLCNITSDNRLDNQFMTLLLTTTYSTLIPPESESSLAKD